MGGERLETVFALVSIGPIFGLSIQIEDQGENCEKDYGCTLPCCHTTPSLRQQVAVLQTNKPGTIDISVAEIALPVQCVHVVRDEQT